MEVNKERLQKVISAMDDIAMAGTRYTFDKFCKEHQLYSQMDRQRIEGVFIVCPFHVDSDPSLSIDENKRRWKCFGCGKGGKYIHFVTLYDNEVLGIQKTVAQKANEILQQDRDLQARVGFQNVFQSSQHFSNEFQKIEFSHFRRKPSGVTSYPELATKMIKEKQGLQAIQLAVSLMQSGISPEVIAKNIDTLEATTSKKEYSVEELEREDV